MAMPTSRTESTNDAKGNNSKILIPPAMPGAKNELKATKSEPLHKTVYVVFVALVIDLLGFTLILPLLPSLLDYYGHHDKGGLYGKILDSVHGFRELVGAPDTPRWNSVLFGGLIGSLFSFLQFVTSPVIGAASDVYGRRPLMLINLAGITLSYLVWALSENFSLFVISRIIGGISKGNISLSTAIATDVTTPRNRGKAMALIGIAFSIGFLIGPMIGALFASWARAQQTEFFIIPALFALMLSLTDIVFLYVFLKESLPESKRARSLTSEFSHVSYLVNPLALFRFSAVNIPSKSDLLGMQHIGSVYFLYLFVYSGLEFTLTFLVHNRFQYDSMQQGKMFFFIGIIMASVQGGYVRRIKPGKEIKAALQGMLLQIPAFFFMAFASNTTIMYIGLIFFSVASATVIPCLTTVISGYGAADQKGTIMGIFRSLGALARALGPIMASTVYWSCGSQICYSLGGVAIAIPAILFMKSQHAPAKAR